MICLAGRLGTPFFWRRSLLPHGCNEYKQCKVMAPPKPPSTLDSVQVNEAVYLPNEDTLSLEVSWMFPVYPNGELRRYQLRVGTLPVKDNQESGITILSLIDIGVSGCMMYVISLF